MRETQSESPLVPSTPSTVLVVLSLVLVVLSLFAAAGGAVAGTKLQTLPSKLTSTLGGASGPTFQSLLTLSGMPHNGTCPAHLWEAVLYPTGHLPLAYLSTSSPRQYGELYRPPYKKAPRTILMTAPTASPNAAALATVTTTLLALDPNPPPPERRVGAPELERGLYDGFGLYGLRELYGMDPVGVLTGGRGVGVGTDGRYAVVGLDGR